MLLFSHHLIPSLSLLLSRFFIGVALEKLVAISCYNFFHLDNKRECFGGFKDLEIYPGSLHAYEVKSFGLNICVIIGRLLGKVVYLTKFSDCIIASLFHLHLLMIESSFDY
jgi:hypothetical protein